ncbi:MAG: acetyl-CoA C-acyltransferase [Pseudomonadales bacterium]
MAAAQAPVFVVDGARTPFLGSSGRGGPFSAVDMAVWAGRPLLLRQPFGPPALDEVLLGCLHPAADEPNPGRLAAFRLGGVTTPGRTVQRGCGSGLQAVDDGCRAIAAGRADLVLVGGAEAHSRQAPLLSADAAAWLDDWHHASTTERARLLAGLRPSHLPVADAVPSDPVDPLSGLTMAQAADAVGYRFGIRRGDADRYALESHHRASRAREAGRVAEIEPLYDAAGTCYLHDDAVRAGVTVEQLAGLEPSVDRPYGNVTAGNSSAPADGAAWLLLASEPACARWSLRPRGRVVDTQWAGLAPQLAGLGPVFAVSPLLLRHGLSAGEVGAWEVDEAFAAQLLACLAAWESDSFCRDHLGLEAAVGPIDRARLNVDGGAIALGRPAGASGTRLVLQLLEVLHRSGERWGMAALAVGGGQGGALLMEAL